jgi:predicted  nucleic acid-binding Zn-ribbon protein
MGNNNQRTITYVLGAIIAILLIGLIFTYVSNVKNKKSLSAEKLTSEACLSEKQKLETNMGILNNDLSVLKQQSDANEKLLSESKFKIAENEKKINSLTGENRSLRTSKKELAELKETKDALDRDYSLLKTENEKLLAQGKELQNSIKTLEAEKNDLATQLNKARLYNTDNFLANATRGKKTEKTVIRASRAKKLNITFEVPQSLTETISFKIVTPTGTTINPDDKEISWFFPVDSRNLTASMSFVTGEFEQSRQVVLNFASKTKLVKGEYKIQIFSNGNNIGNCRIMLR